MARASQDKPYTSFQNGFVTEATGLTFPENSCRDVDNCDIELNGTIRRRLGLNQEANGYNIAIGQVVIQQPAPAAFPGKSPGQYEYCTKEQLAITVHTWPHPGGNTSLNFLVLQVGTKLYLLNWDAEPVTDLGQIANLISPPGLNSFDLASTGGLSFLYNASNLQAAKTPLQSAVGYQRIWFTSPAVVPFYIEYEPDTLAWHVRPVGFNPDSPTHPYGNLTIRDFNGIDESLEVDENPLVLTDEHKYNLLNQGWSNGRWNSYYNDRGVYPNNTQQWILGKNSSDNFEPDLLAKQDFGNSPAPKGRITMHALLGSRDKTIDDVTVNFSGKYDEKATESFRATAFYGGRVWFAGDSNPKRPNGVYFSKTLSNVLDAGVLMQENDPTSEHFPDLLDTDGGVIYLTEADNIQRLVPFGAGLLVLASNGIWFIYGGDGGFTATSFSVEKVSSTGILSASSVILADQQVAFFAENSIHLLALPDEGIIPVILDIAQGKILSFYGRIHPEARMRAQGAYDTIGKKAFWSWLELDSPGDYNYPAYQSCFNRMLVFDTRTGAFTKYSFTPDADGNFFYNGPVFPKRRLTRPVVLEGVFDSTGEIVWDFSLEEVTIQLEVETNDFLNSIKVVAIGGTLSGIRVLEFTDVTFYDYSFLPDITTQAYSSHVITADETLGDLQRNKQATYLHSFFKRTETGFIGTTEGFVPRNASGCSVIARWDWHNTGAGGKWSPPQAAYRYRRPYAPAGPSDPLDTGEGIVYTKLKIRGRGRSLALRYDSVPGKDFQLLGYSVAYTASGV